MTKAYPLLIAAVVLALAGPAAVKWIGGLTHDVANAAAAEMAGE